MARLYGIDGCPAGWLCTVKDQHTDEQPKGFIIGHLDELTPRLAADDNIAIDMPSGLDAENLVTHGRRECDLTARQALGNRACCVFFAPARGVLSNMANHPTASQWHRKYTGRGLSCQTFSLLPKLKELDDWLRRNSGFIPRVSEVHPELSFAFWQGNGVACGPLANGKKTAEGYLVRKALIERRWPGAIDNISWSLGPKSSVEHERRRRWEKDDLLDALAALWTAERIASGVEVSHPNHKNPPVDACGLPMRIRA